MLNKINCTNDRYGVEFREGYDGTIIADAVINDGQSYGGSSFWFRIGTYKTMKSAIRYAAKKMAQFNKELKVA